MPFLFWWGIETNWIHPVNYNHYQSAVRALNTILFSVSHVFLSERKIHFAYLFLIINLIILTTKKDLPLVFWNGSVTLVSRKNSERTKTHTNFNMFSLHLTLS